VQPLSTSFLVSQTGRALIRYLDLEDIETGGLDLLPLRIKTISNFFSYFSRKKKENDFKNTFSTLPKKVPQYKRSKEASAQDHENANPIALIALPLLHR